MTTPLPQLLDINDLNFDAVVLRAERPFLLDVSSAWCGPCKALDPVLKALAVELAPRVLLGKLDIGDSPVVAARLGIKGTPTLLLFHRGAEIRRRLGAMTRRGLVELCEVE